MNQNLNIFNFKIKLSAFLLVFILAVSFQTNTAFANFPDWLLELDYSPRLAPIKGAPGCEIYRIMLKETPDPLVSTDIVYEVDTNKNIIDLLEACPQDGSVGPCPVETLDRFLPEVPAPEILAQMPNVTVQGNRAYCKANYACGGVEIIKDGVPQIDFGCVPLVSQDPQGKECKYPKSVINGVCQHDCAELCPAGQKCSIRILEGSTECGDEEPAILYFCENVANKEPPSEVVPAGSAPYIHPPTGNPIIMPRFPCPAECPTTCVYPTDIRGLPGAGVVPYCPAPTTPGIALPAGKCPLKTRNGGLIMTSPGSNAKCPNSYKPAPGNGKKMCNANCPAGQKYCVALPPKMIDCDCVKKETPPKWLGRSSGGGGGKKTMKLVKPVKPEPNPNCAPAVYENYGARSRIPKGTTAEDFTKRYGASTSMTDQKF